MKHSGKLQKSPAEMMNAEGKGAFAKVKITDYDMSEPYFVGTVSINRMPDYDNECYSFKALDIKTADHTKAFGHSRDIIKGDYFSADSDRLTVMEYVGKDHPEYSKCVELEKEFDDIHKNAPYVITGRVFSDEPRDPNTRYKTYNIIEEKEWKPSEVHSLEDAEKWILENHPDYYMGFGVHQECPSGNLRYGAVPCAEYPDGMYENAENRRKYAEMRAEQLGVDIGPIEHEALADKSLGIGNIYDTDFDIK